VSLRPHEHPTPLRTSNARSHTASGIRASVSASCCGPSGEKKSSMSGSGAWGWTLRCWLRVVPNLRARTQAAAFQFVSAAPEMLESIRASHRTARLCGSYATHELAEGAGDGEWAVC
jgi:hypothetical protein